MAFTDGQKMKIRACLGYPQVYKYANPRLESAIDLVGADVDAAEEVETILDAIADVDEKITAALKTAGLKSVGKGAVEWYEGGAELQGKRNEGRAYCGRLSIIFGVPIANDYFGRAGYTNDEWMSAGNQYGGILPHC